MTNEEAAQNDERDFARIIAILDRRSPVHLLPALIQALKSDSAIADLATAAIVIDANAMLRIPGHRKSADIIDYLGGVHPNSVILPSQVIQEFWNNQLNVANIVFKIIHSKTSDLNKEVAKAGGTGVISLDGIAAAVEEFKKENEHVFDPNLVQKTLTFLERLQASAAVPHAPRVMLHDLALQRKMTKTPPGFKDDGDGDFLVWVDALWGLDKAKKQGAAFQSVILLTNDKKNDWCRGFVAHPVLYAELMAVLGVHFEVWTLDHFVKQLA
jgi:hypothetical protein